MLTKSFGRCMKPTKDRDYKYRIAHRKEICKYMKTYKYKKRYYICDMVSLALWLVIVFCAAYRYTRSFWGTFALLVLALLGVIPAMGFIWFDYKNPAQISEEKLVVPNSGNIHEISFDQIVGIRHFGIPHTRVLESLIIDCGSFGKVGVGSYHENNSAFWRQIIENAKAKNPNVVIDPKLEKRLYKTGKQR